MFICILFGKFFSVFVFFSDCFSCLSFYPLTSTIVSSSFVFDRNYSQFYRKQSGFSPGSKFVLSRYHFAFMPSYFQIQSVFYDRWIYEPCSVNLRINIVHPPFYPLLNLMTDFNLIPLGFWRSVYSAICASVCF